MEQAIRCPHCDGEEIELKTLSSPLTRVKQEVTHCKTCGHDWVEERND